MLRKATDLRDYKLDARSEENGSVYNFCVDDLQCRMALLIAPC